MAEQDKKTKNYFAAFLSKVTVQNQGLFPYEGDGDLEAAKAEFMTILDEALGKGNYSLTEFRLYEEEAEEAILPVETEAPKTVH